MRVPELIERKRNGEELSEEEISELVLGFTREEIPDYQMAAWCMAVYFRGLTGRETHALTDAMIAPGRRSSSARRSAGGWSTSTRRAAWGTRRRSPSGPSWRPAAFRSGR
jgi:anthranilate phosphoribosyltransferase